jgi:uncharacterized protein YuzE
MGKKTSVGFELSISARNDGTLEAAYIQLSELAVARTREIVEDVLLADYDSRGGIVGLEILAPVKLSDLTKLVDRSKRPAFKRFVARSAPRDFVTN